MKERVGLIQSKPGVGSIEDDLGKFVEQYLNGKLPGKRQRVTMTQTVQVKLDGVQRTFQAYAHALAHASSSLMPPPRPASSSPCLLLAPPQAWQANSNSRSRSHFLLPRTRTHCFVLITTSFSHRCPVSDYLGRLKDAQRDDDLTPPQLRANLELLKATAEDPHGISGATMMKASMVISLNNTMRAAKTPPAQTPSGADSGASRTSCPSCVTATASGSGAASEASEQDAASASASPSPSGANAYFNKLQRAVKREAALKEGPGVYAFAMGTPTELSVKEMTFRYLHANKEKTKGDLIALAEAGGNDELVELLMAQQEISSGDVDVWAGHDRDAEVKDLVNTAIHAFSHGHTGELDRASAEIARLMCLEPAPAVGAGQGVVRMTVGLSTQDVRNRLRSHLGKSMRGQGMLLAEEYNALKDNQKAKVRESPGRPAHSRLALTLTPAHSLVQAQGDFPGHWSLRRRCGFREAQVLLVQPRGAVSRSSRGLCARGTVGGRAGHLAARDGALAGRALFGGGRQVR